MPAPSPPFSVSFDLATLSEGGADVTLSPGEAERSAIADWLGASALESLSASVRLSRSGTGRYDYAASFAADVVQPCVVTLAPVRSHLEGQFTRAFRVVERPSRRRPPPIRSLELGTGDEDEPELLSSSAIDLAVPVLEELSLALDPYPRAEGARFEALPEERSEPASPFAVLGRLKQKAAGKARTGTGRERPAAPKPSPKSREKPGKDTGDRER